MPFIHVMSLPLDDSFDASTLIEGLMEDFAKETGTGVEHVTATREVLPPGHYAIGGKVPLHPYRYGV